MNQVWDFPASDAHVFPQYLLPALARFSTDPEMAVQLAFADCLPRLAECSRRFLDVHQWATQLAAIDAAVARQRRTQSKRSGSDASGGAAEADDDADAASGALASQRRRHGGGGAAGSAMAREVARGVAATSTLYAPLSQHIMEGIRVPGGYDAALQLLQQKVKDVWQRWVAQLADPTSGRGSSSEAAAAESTATLIKTRLLQVGELQHQHPQ